MRTEIVTTLKQRATEIISALDQDHQPALTTQHGKPTAYLVDVETFERLQQRLSILENVARGERAVEDGRTLSYTKANKRLARWLN